MFWAYSKLSSLLVRDNGDDQKKAELSFIANNTVMLPVIDSSLSGSVLKVTVITPKEMTITLLTAQAVITDKRMPKTSGMIAFSRPNLRVKEGGSAEFDLDFKHPILADLTFK